MRKTVCILSAILFIFTIVTGIAEASPQHNGPPVAHILMAIFLIFIILIHVWINRKAAVRYFVSSGTKSTISEENVQKRG